MIVYNVNSFSPLQTFFVLAYRMFNFITLGIFNVILGFFVLESREFEHRRVETLKIRRFETMLE